MQPFDIEFPVNGNTYTAKLLVHQDSEPKLFEIYDITPPDYSPGLPYIFTPNKLTGKLYFPVSHSNNEDLTFGGPIISAIMSKCEELGISVFE